MASFKAELPNDLIKAFEAIEKNVPEILEGATQEGAKDVLEAIKSNVPHSWLTSDIMRCLKVTKTYRTPSDGGVNTKVAFYGYFQNRYDVRTPAELVCNVTEYGRSDGSYPKKPFMRKSFNKNRIQKKLENYVDRYLEKLYSANGGY